MITVIDSLMGSGKTSWATQYAREHQDTNILFISPFLTELDDFIAETVVDGIETFVQPEQNKKHNKLEDIIKMLESEKNICCTHELFIKFDEKCQKIINENHYILIVDEAIQCLQLFHLNAKNDIKSLLDDGILEKEGDELRPTDLAYKEKGTSKEYCINVAKSKRLFMIDNDCYIWIYPPDIWDKFDNVYVMTYNFNGCLLKYYFDYYQIKFNKVSVLKKNDKYILTHHYEPSKAEYKKLIDIYEDKNSQLAFTAKHGALSATFFRNYKANGKEIEALRRRAYNYIRNITNAKTNEIMWTTFDPETKGKTKPAKQLLLSKGLANSSFVAVNKRATDQYSDKSVLVYLANRFENPEIRKFFTNRNISFDDDAYAISELLQWIWRSRIRKGQSIQLFIPSRRMRELLKKWLNDCQISNE